MSVSGRKKLERFYELFSGNDHVLVLINADPDAIACAMAVKRLLWRKTASVTLSNINIVKRPDNLAMVRLLGVSLIYIKEIKISDYNRFIIVDSQPDHNENFQKINYDAVIDHHPDSGIQAPFVDIRPKYGAAATILTEYLKAAKIKPSVKLATALYYAIKTDTQNFKRQTIIEDVRAFQFLFRHANITLARRIDQADIRLNFLNYFAIALKTKRIRKGKVFVHLGKVPNPDICVLIADFFMRIDSINWSIISGIYDKKLIIIFRNDGLRINAGKMAKKSFGALGSAGGHKSIARAEIKISNLDSLLKQQNTKKQGNWIIKQVEKPAVKKIPVIDQKL